ncbi:MAG: saccharopine dehydrogenase C-terminal domain-containing protein [Planctomycetota bacterium]
MSANSPRAVVLGSGMIGTLMAKDLLAHGDFQVTQDRSQDALQAAAARMPDGSQLATRVCDLTDPETLKSLAREHDVVLGALSSHLGYQALGALCTTGKPYVDISFMEENALDWHAQAKEHGSVCVVDCGVAPGMSNLLAGAGVGALDQAEALEIYVGGLPRERHWPFEYKAGFSPADVIEEYTRPARFVEEGKIIVREALSDAEIIEFEGAGELEAFLTDGLRSLIRTLDVPNMVEKTLRYPGHIELMRVFRDTGLFRKGKIRVGDQMVVPREVTAALLFPKWTFEEGEEDVTVMRIVVRGKQGGKDRILQWDLLEPYSQAERATSMSRTTALPATLMARDF